MGESTYINPEFCLECATKHSRDLEHHLEDGVTATRGMPERERFQDLVDRIRLLRKDIDDMRINELAKKKLRGLA